MSEEKNDWERRLSSFYEERKKDSPLGKFRDEAWARFQEMGGLPSKGTAGFEPLRLRSLWAQKWHLAACQAVLHSEIAHWIHPDCRHAVVVFINGHYVPALSDYTALPKELVILPLEEAAQVYGSYLNHTLKKHVKEEKDPIALLNGALYGEGCFIYLPSKTLANHPVQILHVSTDEGVHLPRLHLCAGAHAHITLIDTPHALKKSGWSNVYVEATVEEGGHVKYKQHLSELDEQAYYFHTLRATLKRDAKFEGVTVSKGAATVRNDYRLTLTGEGGDAFLSSLAVLEENRESHAHVCIDHQAPNCRSYQLFKAVLGGSSHSSFAGKIMVRQEAQKTEAFQLNKNLLLSDNALVESRPNLEILADDVKASHGATTGQPDEEMLFYMKTRGIPEAEAKRLLVDGFCREIFALLEGS